jgi:hypothetical protein
VRRVGSRGFVLSALAVVVAASVTVVVVSALRSRPATHGSVKPGGVVAPADTASTGETTGAVPETATDVVSSQLPTSVHLIRDFSLPNPTGTVTRTKWFGPTDTQPSYAMTLTSGPGAGTWMAHADSYAASVQPSGESAVAGFAGTVVVVPEHFSIKGADAIIFGNFAGWVEVTWSPRDDILVSVTGLHASPSDMKAIAKSVAIK